MAARLTGVIQKRRHLLDMSRRPVLSLLQPAPPESRSLHLCFSNTGCAVFPTLRTRAHRSTIYYLVSEFFHVLASKLT